MVWWKQAIGLSYQVNMEALSNLFEAKIEGTHSVYILVQSASLLQHPNHEYSSLKMQAEFEVQVTEESESRQACLTKTRKRQEYVHPVTADLHDSALQNPHVSLPREISS